MEVYLKNSFVYCHLVVTIWSSPLSPEIQTTATSIGQTRKDILSGAQDCRLSVIQDGSHVDPLILA